jgi:hypothetical protein
MTDVKVQIKIGGVEFSGEGDKDWLGKQLDKILTNAQALANLAIVRSDESKGGAHNPMGSDKTISDKSLAVFLKEKNATTNQIKKFLATAVWLEAKGNTKIATSDVVKALRDSSQSRLGNPSDCLGQNVQKGHCEKDGKQFFVTEEGKASL